MYIQFYLRHDYVTKNAYSRAFLPATCGKILVSAVSQVRNYISLRKIPIFHLISLFGNFVETPRKLDKMKTVHFHKIFTPGVRSNFGFLCSLSHQQHIFSSLDQMSLIKTKLIYFHISHTKIL